MDRRQPTRRLAAWLAIFLTIILLAGCGGAGTATAPAAIGPTATDLSTTSAAETTPISTLTPPPLATLEPAPSTSVTSNPCAPDGCAPETPPPSAGAASPRSLPVTASALDLTWVRMSPGPDGGLYVAVTAQERTILAAYDRGGAVRPGWPIAISPTEYCDLASASDGSIRVVCGSRAFAFDAAGNPLPGWPVDLPETITSEWRLVDGQLYLQLPGRLARISANGTPSLGTPGFGGDATAADWTQFSVDRAQYCEKDTTITATDLTGIRPGWPITVPCGSSDPVSGPDGRVYVVQGSWDAKVSHILAFERDGRPVAGWSVELPGSAPHVGSWADPYIPAPPLVAADGTVWFATETTAYAVDATGHLRPGWPYRSSVNLGYVGYCGPCDIDCYLSPSRPLIGPDDVLYLPQEASSGSVGGQITAIGPEGMVRDGWPVVLRQSGAAFWSVVAGPDGMVYALAIEPEGPAEPPKGACAPPASATILAIGPDGQVRYRVTVVEP